MKRGGAYLSAFGLPFLLAGLFVLQIPFDIVPVHLEERPIVLALLLPLGFVFTVAGAALVFGRSGVTINRRDRTVARWWGVLVPVKRTEYLLDAFEYILLDIHAGDKNTGDTCIVHLIGSGNTAPFYIPSPADHEGARRTAEQLSDFLGIPFEDAVVEGQADTD
ncbi:MAG: hypothetical protein KBB65_09400 [Syntrophorhabdaceae bacterium]|nr:hypothetical protein [Syntrophorhabdaceae bacterium]